MRKIDLSDKALGELISKSEAATPGSRKVTGGNGVPWAILRKGKINGQILFIAQVDTTEEDAAFIAACDPETVRELSRTLGITRWELGVCKTTIAALEEKLSRLEREADFLAQYAANESWYGMRVSAAFMREKARKAVEGI